MDKPMTVAQRNLELLTQNPYPGRGIVIGMTLNGRYIVQLYWVMGRSANSQNRLLDHDETGRLFTIPADPSKVVDPSLIIYDAMLEYEGLFAVSNGDQTVDVIRNARSSRYLCNMLSERTYEPDKPNYTSRITGLFDLQLQGPPVGQFLILQRSLWGDSCERRSYELELAPGFGFGITTYMGDGDPLPSFRGDPSLFPISGIDASLDVFWNALNSDNRVAMACKAIDRKTGGSMIFVENRFTAVEDQPETPLT